MRFYAVLEIKHALPWRQYQEGSPEYRQTLDQVTERLVFMQKKLEFAWTVIIT